MTTGTTIVVGAVKRPSAPRQAVEARRSASGERLQKYSLHLVAASVGAVALFLPVLWLAICLVGAFCLAVSKPARGKSKRGTADVVVIPVQILQGSLQWAAELLKSKNLIRLLTRTLVTCAAVAVITGAFSAILWVVREGTEGALAAARLGLWNNGPRLLSAAICARVVLGNDDQERRSAAIQLRARGLSELTLTGIAVGVCLWISIAGLVLPVAGWAPFASGEAFVEALPLGPELLRDVQVAVATNQARSVLDCLDANIGYVGFRLEDVANVTDGTVSVVVTYRSSGREMTENDAAILMATLHNQLAPWVSSITLRFFGDLTLDRHAASQGSTPTTDPADLEATLRSGSMPVASGDSARSVILECSASTL